ncbi:MAG: hypothetical protein ABI543_08870 [Ignavibacteria bacterium]
MKKINLKYRISALIVAAFFSIARLNGCGDTVTTPPQVDNLTFSGAGSQDSIGDGTGIFVIDTVKILIKDIKVKVANNNEDSTNFKVGPFVLFLNLSSNVTVISSSIVPVGNYRKVKFEIHKLEDTEAIPDPEFADANGRYSVIVKGSYLGNYFVYKSSKSAHQILQFPNDVPVAAIAGTNLTLVVRPYIWFIKNDVYMDPFDPTNMNDIDNNIKDNIKNNFKAFKDDDRNGIPD